MNFWYGFITGLAFVTVIAYIIPMHIVPVQHELVKLNHGYFDSKTKDFKLKECK